MAQEMPISARVKCSGCGEWYELGDFCLDNEGKKLTWLVLSQGVSSVEEALAHVLCQDCHGYKDGESVQACIEKLGVQTTAAPRLLTRQEINARVQANKQRVSIGIRSDPVKPDARKSIGVVLAPNPLRTSIGLLADPVRARPTQIGLVRPAPSERPQVPVFQPQADQGRTDVRPVTRAEEHRTSAVRPTRGVNLGSELLSRLEMAHGSSDHREFDRLLALAVQANLSHPLTNDAIRAKFEAERKAREDERKAEQVRREKPFKTAIAQAKRFLTLARKTRGSEETLGYVDSMEDQIEKALASDLKMRSYKEILVLVGLTIRELHELRVSDFLGKTAVPDPSPGATIGTFVKNVRRMHPTKSHLPRANPPFAMQVDAGHIPDVLPKIIYGEADRYGDQPYLLFPDNRHQFMASIESGDEPESFMGRGQVARMEYVKEYGWGYQPYSANDDRLHPEFRFGTFERGYVPLDRIVAQSLAVTVIETVEVQADGSIKLGSLAMASVLMKSGDVETFEIPSHPDLLKGNEVILVNAINTTEQVMILLPQRVAHRNELPDRPRGPHPTERRCIVLPDAPYRTGPRPLNP